MNEQQLFFNALQKTDLQERLAYLRDACGDDDLLRQRVEALVLAHQKQQLESAALAARQEGTFIEDRSPINAAADAIDDEYYTARAKEESVGATIGPYKLLQKLGQGGMGTVWMAEQKQPVRRTVALKLVKAGMDTSEVISRFQAERQALALMNHPVPGPSNLLITFGRNMRREKSSARF